MKDSPMNLKSLFSRFWSFLLFFLVLTAFFWKVVFLGYAALPADFAVGVYYPWLDYKWDFPAGVPVKNPITTDVVSFMYPMQTLASNYLKSFKAPLWNPLILAGTPLFANFQSAPFSPAALFYFLVDDITAWNIQIMLSHFVAFLGVYLLLIYWKQDKFASFVAGFIYAFCGYNLIWSQWNGHTLSAAFIPFIVLFVDKFLDSRKFYYGILISIFVLGQILSGYPQVVFYTLIAVGVLWLTKISLRKEYIFSTFFLGLFIALGIGMSTFQILPAAELLGLSQREIEPHPFEWAFLPWSKTITFVVPDYYGNHATKNYWGPQDYTSNTGFVGVVGVVFLFLGSRLWKQNYRVRFLLTLLLVGLVLSYPTFVSIFIWRSGAFGFQAASAHRALVLFDLAASLLAGFGTALFLKKRRFILSDLLALVPAFLVLAGFGVYALVLFFQTKSDPSLFLIRGIPKYQVALRNIVLPTFSFIFIFVIFLAKRFRVSNILLSIGILTVLIVEVFYFGWKFTPFSPRRIVFPDTPITAFLKSQKKPFRTTGSRVIPINMRMPYGIETLEGYDAIYPLWVSKFIAAINGRKSGTDPQGRYATIEYDTSPLLDLINVRYYLTLKQDDMNNPDINGDVPARFDNSRFELAFEDKTTVVMESKSVLPRAFMVYDWEIIEDGNETIDMLLDPGFDFTQKAVLSRDPGIARSEEKVDSSVSYTSYGGQESLIAVETEKSGILFVSDAWFPGWKAYVDGNLSEIIRANYAFRGISVPAGEHEVLLRYEPESYKSGVLVSAIAFMSIIPIYLLFKLGKKYI